VVDGVDLAHVRKRLRLLARPNAHITAPPEGIRFDRDVAVPVRDGTVLRVNVFRPEDDAPHPVILSAHPYGKDGLPKPKRGRRGGYATPFQLRMLPQSVPFGFSAWTSWEAPDPATWVPRGYALVNCDLRGWGTSDGTGELLAAQEGDDVHDVVEWIAAQPWSNGRVGMLGVSYLALTQWAAAATRPPHLAAISPWEGFTDAYRDFVRVGGVLEDGFLRLWSALLRRQQRSPVTIRRDAQAHPLFDDWWAARNRDVERIDVPALVAATFSDHNLHSRGTFEGFRRIGSTRKWLYAHRGPKWATFYGDEARAVQQQFFDHFLRDGAPASGGMHDVPRVRYEVHEDAATRVARRTDSEWPPVGTWWEALRLGPSSTLVPHDDPAAESVEFDLRRGHARFSYRFDEDTELVGPMWLRVHLELRGADDMCLFAGVRKERRGKLVGFEGSYGFDRALVTFGMRKPSQRAVDPDRAALARPFHPDDRREPLAPGEIVAIDLELPPSATLFRAGEHLILDLQGRWFFPTNPLLGQFPARYERSGRGTCVLHVGGEHDAALHVPRR
jgi:predicted acyl esterase